LKETDYSKIANRYDANPIRTDLSREPIIENILKAKSDSISLLDLACGTGNFLQKQHEEYKYDKIAWYGCDLSKEMLDIAYRKAPFANLKLSDAASLPYPDASFDIVTCDFAFHHFTDKLSCIKEISRTLKNDGVIKMTNICPEHMPSSWVYHYFPSTRAIDNDRFWSGQTLFSEFTKHGFIVETEITIRMKNFTLSELIAEAINRDMSQLNLIDDIEYNNGIEKMKNGIEKNKDYFGEFSLLRLVAKKVDKRNG
jgi:ubiquinone/menaquinone biosynthesis C-methylase UbiE